MFHLHFSYIRFSIFFNLNLCFLMNSELITNLIAPLSNSTSTITPFYISILSNSIFTITSLKSFSLFRLQIDIFSATLLSIANLFVLEPNQGLLGFLPHLKCFLYSDCPHILLSFLNPQFPISYNSV